MKNIRREKVVNELMANGGSMGKAMRKAGYSPNFAHNPKKLTDSIAFKEIINPIITKMITERNRLIDALSIKDLNTERYKDLVDGVDKLTKNIQLLSGGVTENVGVVSGLTQEEKDKLLGLL